MCGSAYGAPTVDSKYCSRRCKQLASNARRRSKLLEAKSTLDRRCTYCDGQLPPGARLTRKFCSLACSRAARFNTHRAGRRMRIEVAGQVEVVTRAAIYERDGWTCMLCADPIDRNRTYPDPMCASLDHVVPLSMGGTNAAENLQASHLVCNMKASNKKKAGSLRPAPQWLGVEYCSANTASKALTLPIGRVRRLLEDGVIPAAPRRPHQPWRIPVTFIEEIVSTGIPEEWLLDRRIKPDKEPKPTHRQLECAHCGQIDLVPISLRSRKRYCSQDCLVAARLERRRSVARRDGTVTVHAKASKTCVVCGQPNPVVRNQLQNLICGQRSCLNELRHRRLVEERLEKRGLPACQHCGDLFTWRERGGGRQPRYCSENCRGEAARVRARKDHQKNSIRRSLEGKQARLAAKNAALRSCESCGAVFPPEARADKRFCSRPCWARARRSI